MRTATIDQEKSIGQVSMRLFPVLPLATRAAVESAILKANPQLAAHGAFVPGAIVRVPQVPGVAAKPTESRDSSQESASNRIDSLSRYRKHLAARWVDARREVEEQVALMKTKEVVRAVKREGPAAVLAATGLMSTLAARSKSIEVDAARQDAALKRLEERLRPTPE